MDNDWKPELKIFHIKIVWPDRFITYIVPAESRDMALIKLGLTWHKDLDFSGRWKLESIEEPSVPDTYSQKIDPPTT